MVDKQILITGAGGLLGTALCEYYHGRYADEQNTIIGHYHRPPNSAMPWSTAQGDLGEKSHIVDLAGRFSPDIIINAAALADVDRCQTEPELSHRINVDAVTYLLDTFPGAFFIHISTDYVFGNGARPGTATDPTAPMNIYGEHKVSAEKATLAASERNLVIRTNTMFDRRGRRSFFRFVYDSLREKKRIRCISDQSSNPLSTRSAAELIDDLMTRKASGIYHIGGNEFVSRLEFARRIATYFDLDNSLIDAITTASLSRPAPRPSIAGLDCRTTEIFLDRAMPALEDEFARIAREASLP